MRKRKKDRTRPVPSASAKRESELAHAHQGPKGKVPRHLRRIMFPGVKKSIPQAVIGIKGLAQTAGRVARIVPCRNFKIDAASLTRLRHAPAKICRFPAEEKALVELADLFEHRLPSEEDRAGYVVHILKRETWQVSERILGDGHSRRRIEGNVSSAHAASLALASGLVDDRSKNRNVRIGLEPRDETGCRRLTNGGIAVEQQEISRLALKRVLNGYVVAAPR